MQALFLDVLDIQHALELFPGIGACNPGPNDAHTCENRPFEAHKPLASPVGRPLASGGSPPSSIPSHFACETQHVSSCEGPAEGYHGGAGRL